MRPVICLCGKLCAGKSTIARQLAAQCDGIILSTDQVLRSRYPQEHFENYEGILAGIREELYTQAVALSKAGRTAILDWGFWERDQRDSFRKRFKEDHVEARWLYICPPDAQWRSYIQKRNEEVLRAPSAEYYIDEGLLKKCIENFQEPSPDEGMEVIIPGEK